MSKERIRLWLVSFTVCIFASTTFNGESVFVNTAHAPIQEYFYNSIAATVYNGTESTYFNSLIWTVFNSINPLGLLCGYLPGALLCDIYGRRSALITVFLIASLSSSLQLAGSSLTVALWPLIFVGRFTLNMAQGMYCVAISIFLNEIVPSDSRGAFGTLISVGFGAGSVIGAALGQREALGTEENWPFAFLFFALVMVVPVPALYLLYESPVFLFAKGKSELAKKSASFYNKSATFEDHDIDRLLKTEESSDLESLKQLLLYPQFRLPMILGVLLGISYIECDIMNMFSTEILETVGFSNHLASQAVFFLKILSFFVLTAVIFSVDYIGRRMFLCISLAGSFCGWALASILQFFGPTDSLASILSSAGGLGLVQIFINIGIRPIFYVILPEIFPYQYKAMAQMLILSTLKTAETLMIFFFVPFMMYANYAAFAGLALIIGIIFLFIFFYLPETKVLKPFEIFPQYETL